MTNLDLILDYVRMISYVIVVLTSLRGILYRKFSSILFVSDIFMAVSLFLVLFHSDILGKDLSKMADVLITPSSVVWALAHFRAMIKENGVR